MGDICKLGLHVLLKFWLGVSMLMRLELLLPKVPVWFSHCCVNSRKLNQRAENVSLACFKLTLPSVPRMPELASSATPYPRLYWFVHILSATFIHTESICWMKFFFNTWYLLWPKPWIFQISLLWIQHKNEPPQDQKGAWTRNFTCMAADKWKPGTHSHISKNWLHMATVHHSSQRIPWNKPL